MSGRVRVAIFPALTRPPTILGCDRRMFMTCVLLGGFLAGPCGLFGGRFTFILLGALVLFGGPAAGAEWTKRDPQIREIVVRAFRYAARYSACGRWDARMRPTKKVRSP